jgi:hypothetical protein
MKRTRRNRPVLEALEGKRLLSGLAGGSPPHASALVASTALPRHLTLDGTIEGTWSREFTNPDVGGAQTLQGSGTLRGLGLVQSSGTLHTPGFVARGHTTGSLTLSNAQGSVTLQLVGTMVQPGFSAPPSSLRYTIVQGTGQYSMASGSGTATLQERPQQGPPRGPVGTMSPDYLIAPSFTLTLHG